MTLNQTSGTLLLLSGKLSSLYMLMAFCICSQNS